MLVRRCWSHACCLSSHIVCQIEVDLAVRRIQNQVASDDEHEWLGPYA